MLLLNILSMVSASKVGNADTALDRKRPMAGSAGIFPFYKQYKVNKSCKGM